MKAFFAKLFDTTDFSPRWDCGNWTAEHGWLHISSDIATWAAYFTIPCLLLYFVTQRRDVPFPRLFWLFALFIFSCGTVHLLEAVIFWWPVYRLDGIVKFITATASWITVLALIPVIPAALQLRSPHELEREIFQRAQAEAKLLETQKNLELHIEKRTDQLNRLNEQLSLEVQHRKQAEQQARYLASIVESSRDAIVGCDLDGTITSWNQGATRMYQYTADEALGQHISMLTAADALDESDEMIELIQDGQPVGSFETYRRRKDGSTVPVSLQVSPIRDDGGQLIGVSCVARDNSESKLVEQALRESEERFRGTFEQAAVGITYIDSAGRFQLMNPRFCEMVGYSQEELSERQFRELVHPEDVGAHDSYFHRLWEGELDSYTLIRRLIRKDGTVFWANKTASLIRTAEGKPKYFVAVIEDVTAQKEFEQELSLRTKELSRSNRELEQFAYIASHDLQEPLRKIRTLGDFLLEDYRDRLDDSGVDYLLRMQSAAERMQNLIRSLLTLSRVATSQRPHSKVDLPKVVHEVQSDLEVLLKETSATVEVGDLASIKADPVQIRQLMQNLMNNAAKFHSEDQPPYIRVWGQVSSDGSCYCIHVRDNGIGFEEKFAERIFEPLQRLHGREKYEGLGMGLAVCKRIAERHGGSISAQSSPGQGATFTVCFPIELLEE